MITQHQPIVSDTLICVPIHAVLDVIGKPIWNYTVAEPPFIDHYFYSIRATGHLYPHHAVDRSVYLQHICSLIIQY